MMFSQFQSTPPARGATAIIGVFQHVADISIHAPREGGDALNPTCKEGFSIFQSTPPARGATSAILVILPNKLISIHAPREGGDFSSFLGGPLRRISIHAPREGGD